jgi:hypothetical protein
MKEMIKKRPYLTAVLLFIALFFIITTIRFSYRSIRIGNRKWTDHNTNELISANVGSQWGYYFTQHRAIGFSEKIVDWRSVVTVQNKLVPMPVSFYLVPGIITALIIGSVFGLFKKSYLSVKSKFVLIGSKSSKVKMLQLEQRISDLEQKK